MITKFNTLQSIVDQLDSCDYLAANGDHSIQPLDESPAFIALKERAAAETETLALKASLPICRCGYLYRNHSAGGNNCPKVRKGNIYGFYKTKEFIKKDVI